MNLVLQKPGDDETDGWYRILVDEKSVYVMPSKGCSYSYFVLAHKILKQHGLCDKVITGFLNNLSLELTVSDTPTTTH